MEDHGGQKTSLHLVHSDVVGPFKTSSLGGARYVLRFIDDCTRKIWMYFLQKKDEVFHKFKEFKVLTKKQSGKSLRIIRTNKGTEYMNKKFFRFCKKNGIKKNQLFCTHHNKMGLQKERIGL